jgi:RNA polymerase sigma-70 factor (family 1)
LLRKNINNTREFEVFFKAHYQRLCFFAQTFLDDKEAAEDIVQESFLKYFDRQNNFESAIAALAFLYTTIRNACFNHLRHLKIEKRFRQTHSESADEEAFTLQTIIRSEALGEINRAIEALPNGCRTIFRLGYVEELKNQEIADFLHVSINTVKTQKARALQLLRLKLKQANFLILLLLLLEIQKNFF